MNARMVSSAVAGQQERRSRTRVRRILVTVGDKKALEQAGGLVRQKHNTRTPLVVVALLTGLSIAIPAVIMVFFSPLNHAEIFYAVGMWPGEIWWPYISIGIA